MFAVRAYLAPVMWVCFSRRCATPAINMCSFIVDYLFGPSSHYPFFVRNSAEQLSEMDWLEVSFIRGVMKIDGVDRSVIQNAQEKVWCFYRSGIASD